MGNWRLSMSEHKYKNWKDNEVHSVTCDCCNSSIISKYHKRSDGMMVTECSECGLAYLNPRPLDHLIDRFYEKEYFTGESAARGIGLTLQEKEDNQIIVGNYADDEPRPIKLIENKLWGLSGKEILEIGCATGDLLLKIKDRGAKVTGLELSDFAAEIAKQKSLNVYMGKIEEFSERLKNHFNMAIALEVIEHVVSPTRFLRCVNGVLKKDGYLLLSTPNYGCAKKYGEGWLGFRTSFEHIWFFSVETLKKLAMKEGFRLLYWETNAVYGNMPGQMSKGEEFWLKMKKWLAIERELGIKELIKLKLKKGLGFYPYGDGHKLFVLLQKTERL